MHKSHYLFGVVLWMHSHLLIAATEDGRWHLGIGDPSVWGWFTVGVYLLAVGCCYYQATAHKLPEQKLSDQSRKFWWLLGVFLLLLAINKQLDLQTWFTQTLKDMAISHGWYEQRRALQVAFVVGIGLTMLVCLLTLRITLVSLWRQYKLVWTGLFLLCTFILLRAASFHHIDIFIRESIYGLELNVVLENLALAVIILGTFFNKPLPANAQQAFTDTVRTLKSYYEASKPGDDVYCPRCATKAHAKAAHERAFKCKFCAYKYLVYVTD
jgi:hypothetical protein